MENGNTGVEHLAWCGLVALHLARRDGLTDSPAQENIFLTRWLATSGKQRPFRKKLANDIRWLLKEGREKGVRANLPGKLGYLWRAVSNDLLAQIDLFRLQHVLNALKRAGWVYMVLNESEWSGRRALKLNPSVSGLYLNKNALTAGFDESGRQRRPLPTRITGNIAVLDRLLARSSWRCEQASSEPQLHYLLTAEPDRIA